MPSQIDFADLNKRISLQSVVETVSPIGEILEDWSEYAEVWASVIPLSGSERVQTGGALGGSVVHRIIVRFREGVTIEDRFIYLGRTFNILAVIDMEEAHEWLRIEAVEAV